VQEIPFTSLIKSESIPKGRVCQHLQLQLQMLTQGVTEIALVIC